MMLIIYLIGIGISYPIWLYIIADLLRGSLCRKLHELDYYDLYGLFFVPLVFSGAWPVVLPTATILFSGKFLLKKFDI